MEFPSLDSSERHFPESEMGVQLLQDDWLKAHVVFAPVVWYPLSFKLLAGLGTFLPLGRFLLQT